MATNKITELLTRTDRGINDTSGPNGILAKMYRVILFDLNITAMRFGKCMKEYLKDPRNGISDDRVAQSSARGNLMKELGKEEMTFKVFMKGLRFLRITKFRFIIEAHHPNGMVTTHSADIDLSGSDAVTEYLNSEDPAPQYDEDEDEDNKKEGAPYGG